MQRFILLFCATVLSACANNAAITKSWMAKDIAGKDLHGTLVLAISEKPEIRQYFEDSFTAALTKRGVKAVASYTLNPAGKITKEDVIAMAHSAKVDTALVTSFAGRDEYEVLHPGATYYGVQPIYTGTGGYYGRGGVYGAPFEIASRPDFYAHHKSLHLEANLYEIATEEHLWQAAAGITEEEDNKEMLASFIGTFVAQLQQDKLIK